MFRSFPRTRESSVPSAGVRGPGSPLSAFALRATADLSSGPAEASCVGGSRGRAGLMLIQFHRDMLEWASFCLLDFRNRELAIDLVGVEFHLVADLDPLEHR